MAIAFFPYGVAVLIIKEFKEYPYMVDLGISVGAYLLIFAGLYFISKHE